MESEKTCRCANCDCKDAPTQPGKNESLWVDIVELPTYPTFTGSKQVDVVVIGGGITGLTAALRLKQAGKKVVLLEAARIGSGVTGYTTAHLTVAVDSRYHELISQFGLAKARQVAEASTTAIDYIEKTAQELHIDCDFKRVPGYLYAESASDLDMLHEEADAAQQVGIEAEFVSDVPLPFATAGGVHFANQAQFHPLKYIGGLAQAFVGNGCNIYEKSAVVTVSPKAPYRVQLNNGTVTADNVIMATHTPIGRMLSIQSKVPAYRSYVLGIRLQQQVLPDGLYWDTADPYHYTRLQATPQGSIVIVGGEDHKTGESNAAEHYRNLEKYTKQHYNKASVEYRWSAQVFEPVDGLPYIGKAPLKSSVYIATGFAGNGMTFGTIAGLLTTDLVLGNKNKWAKLFAPTRIKISALFTEMLKENLNIAMHFFGDRLKKGAQGIAADLQPGEGKLMQINGKKLAVYKDKQGTITKLSPVCTHAGCIVQWNTAEATWDCPCHGGRYAPTGKVIVGPPVKDLARES